MIEESRWMNKIVNDERRSQVAEEDGYRGKKRPKANEDRDWPEEKPEGRRRPGSTKGETGAPLKTEVDERRSREDVEERSQQKEKPGGRRRLRPSKTEADDDQNRREKKPKAGANCDQREEVLGMKNWKQRGPRRTNGKSLKNLSFRRKISIIPTNAEFKLCKISKTFYDSMRAFEGDWRSQETDQSTITPRKSAL